MIQQNGLQMIELADVFLNSLILYNTPTVRVSAVKVQMATVDQIAMTADSHILQETKISGNLRIPCADATLTDISN